MSQPLADELIDRLRRFISIDVIACTIGVVALILVQFAVDDSGWVVVLAAMVLATGALIATALVPLRRGDVRQAVLVLALANWAIAVGASTIATFAYPILLLVTLLPVILAIPYVDTPDLRRMAAGSMLVAVAVAAVGTLQDFSGLSGHLPSWVEPSIIVSFMPVMLGLIGIIAFQNAAILRRAADELRDSRARVVAASDHARRNVERNLHDGAQQQLVAAAIRLAIERDRATKTDAALSDRLGQIHRQLHLAIDELRELAQGLYPQVLTEHGLAAAVDGAVHRSTLEVTTDLRLTRRHGNQVEAAVYFCCLEALQNAAKHAARAHLSVSLWEANDFVHFEVSDDGPGLDGATERQGQGFQNMHDRVGAAGGWLRITSPGRGTVVRGAVPTQ